MKVFIDGMKCVHCAARVKKALEAIGLSAEIDLENKCAAVTGEADEAAIKKAVEDAGYTFVSVSRA
ncbi:MAG: heavy-metal-associated domain-containing protein [Clostridia bacterium]|nr:heavy-metal-associated domain-containing protein [Clostridia bacterium]